VDGCVPFYKFVGGFVFNCHTCPGSHQFLYQCNLVPRMLILMCGVIVLPGVWPSCVKSAVWAPIIVMFVKDCGGVMVVLAFFVSSIVIG